MRLLERNPRLSGLMLGLAVLALDTLEISSTQPGSIAVFPKVISDGTRDTIISLTNTTNMMAYVHCEATNGIGECVGAPAGQTYYCNSDVDCDDVTDPSGAPLEDVGPCDIAWQANDFGLVLTAQQPTFWRVSTGRVQDPELLSGDACTTGGQSQQICPGFFLGDSQAGASILPAAGAFRGEIRCFQVEDSSGALSTGNALKGEAIIEWLGETGEGAGQISAYNSLNVQGSGTAPAELFTANLDGVEYASCPDSLTVDHLAPGVTDPVSGADVEVELTFVPCTYDPLNPTSMRVLFNTYDMIEDPLSGGDTRACWANYTGSLDGALRDRATTYLRTTARATQTGNCTAGSADGEPCTADSDCGRGGFCFDNSCNGGSAIGWTCAADGDCGTGGSCGDPSGILGVAETIYTGSVVASSADVAHQVGTRETADSMSTSGDF